MERTMMWVALGIGVAGWICTFLLGFSRNSSSRGVPTSPGECAVAPAFQWLALALPVAIWLLTLPTHPPFSSGQGWGRGFLLGGGASWVSALLIFKAISRQDDDYSRTIAATSSLFAAIIIVCIPLVWMRHVVIEALVGEALGWVAVSLVFLFGQDRSKNELHNGLSSVLLQNGAAFITTLSGVAALGVYRDFVVASVARGTFGAIVIVLAGAIALTALFGLVIGDMARELGPKTTSRQPTFFPNLAAVFLILVIPLGLSALISIKMLDDLSPTYCIGIGTVLGFLLWWLTRDSVSNNEETASVSPTQVPVAAMLVALCGFMLAYQIMQGFGVGLMLLAAWPVSLLALPATVHPRTGEGAALELPNFIDRLKTGQALARLLAFVAVLLLSRLFEMRFRADLRGSSLSDQFALFGFLCGAVVPSMLAALSFSGDDGTASKSLLHAFSVRAGLPRLLLIGVLALALPGGMLALWGAKVLPAFFAGLALATMLSTSRWKNASQAAIVSSLSLAIALALAQWTHRFAPLAEASRAQRLHFLLWGVGGLIILILLFDYSSRLILAINQRKQVSPEGVAP